MVTDSDSRSSSIADILAKYETKKKPNPCPVGRKYISEAQRRLDIGLDVTNRSLNSTTGQNPESQDVTMEDSWLEMDRRQGGLELLRKRKSLSRRIGRTMGGDFNQFTMVAPRFDPRIHYLPSCSEDSEDEEPEKATGQPQKVEQFGGSQGRIGEGCSTPRHINNTMTMLKQIDVSAVSFNSTSIVQVAAPACVGNNTVEMVEVNTTVEGSTCEILEAFKSKKEVEPIIEPIQLDSDRNTFVVEERDMETTGGTYTVNKEGGTFTTREGTFTIEPKVEPGKSDFPKRKSTLSHTLDKALPKSSHTEELKPFARTEHKAKLPEKCEVAPKPAIVTRESASRKSVVNKRQSVQFAGISSPASVGFGYGVPRVSKIPRALPDTPTRNVGIKSASPGRGENTIQMLDIDPDSSRSLESMVDAVSDPRISFVQDTPKKGNRRSKAISKGMSPLPSNAPHYAQPTISSTAKSPRASMASTCRHFRTFEDSGNNESSSFMEIDPTLQATMTEVDENLLRSGFRPRMVNKIAVQSRLRQLNADFNDNEAQKSRMEEKRRTFLERRLNETRAPSTPKAIPEKSTMDILEQHIEQVVQFQTDVEEKEIKENIQSEIDIEFERITEELKELPLPSTPTGPRNKFSHVEDFPELDANPYENDDANSTTEEGLIIKQSQKPVNDSIFSTNDPTPPRQIYKKKYQMSDENSMIEEDSNGHMAMVLKPRKLIRPETPEDGLRRSKRTRIAPLRTWMGEQAVYATSPGGTSSLVGANKVVVKDPRYVRSKTTDPIRALDRERKFKQ